MRVELGGTATEQIGRISVSGIATLDGTLDIVLVNDFLPSVGDTFAFFTYDSRIGTFHSILGTDLSNGNKLLLDFGLNGLVLVTV